jgi:hypothetical protein
MHQVIKNKKKSEVVIHSQTKKNGRLWTAVEPETLKNLININIPVIIFHENNITNYQQLYIKNKTPTLNIKFINILEKAFLKIKENIIADYDTLIFPIGYRHMCSFWFVDFWKYVKSYKKILRIDEDCYIDFNIDTIFYLLNNKIAIYGHWENDAKFVTKGLQKFTLDFFKNKNISRSPRIISGPYTNIIGFNLDLLRNNKLLFEYINEIDKSNNIYIYRWGDLPLWGEVLYYLYNKDEHLLLNKYK